MPRLALVLRAVSAGFPLMFIRLPAFRPVVLRFLAWSGVLLLSVHLSVLPAVPARLQVTGEPVTPAR
ncbi:hypothetical protein OPIT5_13380 [Opitutaceae bacterium TAV5]|nr:hypothetical protein OPIT5_13380 [Opitutaceae bacterium TAV5]